MINFEDIIRTPKDLQQMFEELAPEHQQNFVHHLITSPEADILHTIGHLKIAKAKKMELIVVANTETLQLLFMDTEQQAIDYCLDKYK